MGGLTDKFTTLEEALAAADAAMQVDLNAIREELDLLNTAIDTLNSNGATNTRYLLAAIGANSPCATCPTPSLTVPPTSDEETGLNFTHCKRTQAFLNAMAKVMVVLDTMSAFAIPFSPSLISDAIAQVIEDFGNSDTTPLPSFPEAVRLVGDGINYVAGNFLVGGTLSAYFASQYLDLRDAVYAGTSAAESQANYAAVITGSALPDYVKPVIIDAAYNALWSYYFDPASTPNLAGLDGTVCAELGECITMNAPADAGGSTYVFEGNTYARITLASMTFYARIADETILTFTFASLAATGGITYAIAADTVMTWTELVAAMGVTPTTIDTSPHQATNAIEFCNLDPA